MATFGLWYLKWNGRAYISRLSDNAHEASVYDFKRRAFSYAVALGNSGWDINYTGAVNGFNDGFELMNFVTFKLNGVGYYITIPYYKYDPAHETLEARDNPRGNGKYWLDWIEGVLTIENINLEGFYWSLENAWMFANYQNNRIPQINPEIIQNIADVIHSYGLKLIWVPYAHTYALENTDIWSPTAIESFDYIFVQPNYYFGKINDFQIWLDEFEAQNEGYSNVFIEYECDNRVQNDENARKRACEYAKYTWDYPHKAYTLEQNLEILTL
ncbi:DUF4855 domain-containing protein [Thermococcus sp.]